MTKRVRVRPVSERLRTAMFRETRVEELTTLDTWAIWPHRNQMGDTIRNTPLSDIRTHLVVVFKEILRAKGTL